LKSVAFAFREPQIGADFTPTWCWHSKLTVSSGSRLRTCLSTGIIEEIGRLRISLGDQPEFLYQSQRESLHHSSRSTHVTVLHALFQALEITIRQPHVELRKEVAEKAGPGFKLPPQKVDVGPNGPKWTETPDVPLAVSA
jgi:hypothetical protein